MRLYGMYYTCKMYLETVQNMEIGSKVITAGPVKYIEGWNEKSIILNELAKITPLRESVQKLYESIPIMYRDVDEFDITETVADTFKEYKRQLVIAMKTIIRTYEAINPQKVAEKEYGFDIKMPEFQNLDDFAGCISDLNFILSQCPYLNSKDASIKYGSVDVGSTWLTFLIAGAAATTVLSNLGKLVDAAAKIKSHATTVKMQEEELRSLELKNGIAAEVLDAFKKTNKILTQNSVSELEQELGELKDGEEKDKAGRSLEKLAYWMDKGMQFYSAIDAPNEIKDVFPVQQEVSYLSDDLMKLIEKKEK